MTSNEIHDFCSYLNIYLMNRFKYKTPPASHNHQTVNARRKLFDLYFRFKPNSHFWKPDTLVIARIGFHSTRKGNGTNLLEMLVHLPSKYGVSKIGMEETNEQSTAFVKTFGFTNIAGNHWIIDVIELRRNLNDYVYIIK